MFKKIKETNTPGCVWIAPVALFVIAVGGWSGWQFLDGLF